MRPVSLFISQLFNGLQTGSIFALVALGYGQAESLQAVKQVENAGEMDSGALLKAALKKMF